MPVFPGAGLGFVDRVGRRSADPLGDATSDHVSVRVVEVPRGPRTPHRHPHSCEVVYVVAGRGRSWEGDESHKVSAGDVVLFPQGVPHATVCVGSEPLMLVCFFPHPDLSRNIEELAGPVRA